MNQKQKPKLPPPKLYQLPQALVKLLPVKLWELPKTRVWLREWLRKQEPKQKQGGE